MKCVLLLFILISISAAQNRKPKSTSSGYSYYVSSNWPSGPSHQGKKSAPSRVESSPEPAKEEPRNEGPKESQSDTPGEHQSYGPRDGQYYGRNEDRLDSRDYGHKDDYYKVVGRHGLGFEKRTATADGLRQPITPESLQHVGKRPTVKELKYVPL